MSRQIVEDVPELIWHSALRRPASPKLVYLDQNHWIYLARAATDHRGADRYIPALQAVRTARGAGTAVFPLSGTHYMETLKIKDPAQRFKLAALMEELSGFTSLLSRSKMMLLELDAAWAVRRGEVAGRLPTCPLLGPGYGWALNSLHKGIIRDLDGRDVTEEARRKIGPKKFDELMGSCYLEMERMMLRGPSDEELPRLRALGWDPHAAERKAEERAESERAFQAVLTDEVRRSPIELANRVFARETLGELFPAFRELHMVYGSDLSDILPSGESQLGRRLMRSMPSSNVSTALKIEDHRNASKRWSSNDIFDIDALSVSVPYCHVVVTDAHRRNALTASGMDKRMETLVLSRLVDLPAHL